MRADLNNEIAHLSGLSQIAHHYRAILCDIWGVLHNGLHAWPEACDALYRFRQTGGTVIMITNAPRPQALVTAQLSEFGVTEGVFDAVTTSGDVTRHLIASMGVPIFHLGPQKDLPLYDELGLELTCLKEAGQVVCTGLFNDRSETPEDYRDLLNEIYARDLPFICANPDIVVKYVDQLIWCAGALAREYRAIGGTTHISGKPHRLIYEHCLEKVNAITGQNLPKTDILAIGDGMITDLMGAKNHGLDILYVSGGIHADEYGDTPYHPDHQKINTFFTSHNASPIAYLPRLVW